MGMSWQSIEIGCKPIWATQDGNSTTSNGYLRNVDKTGGFRIEQKGVHENTCESHKYMCRQLCYAIGIGSHI